MGGPGSGRRKQAETIAKSMEQNMAQVTTGSPAPIELREVTQPTGSVLKVQGRDEEKFYNAQKRKYLAENKFDAITDLADLDALLMHELLDFRYSTQLASGKNYEGLFLNYAAEEQLRQNKLAEAKVIGEIKKNLALNRAARDASQGSTADYISDLLKRAKEFGINRDNQIVKAIVLAQELKSVVETFDRSNDTEKRVVGIESEADIVQWVREKFIPGFDAVDLAFRENQKLWKGTL
jgi:thymidylate synthase